MNIVPKVCLVCITHRSLTEKLDPFLFTSEGWSRRLCVKLAFAICIAEIVEFLFSLYLEKNVVSVFFPPETSHLVSSSFVHHFSSFISLLNPQTVNSQMCQQVFFFFFFVPSCHRGPNNWKIQQVTMETQIHTHTIHTNTDISMFDRQTTRDQTNHALSLSLSLSRVTNQF